MRVLNTFTSNGIDDYYFDVTDSRIVFELGDYKIYKIFDKNFLHTYKNISVSQLCGVNKDLIKSLYDNEMNCKHFLYERAKMFIDRGLSYLEKEQVLAKQQSSKAVGGKE